MQMQEPRHAARDEAIAVSCAEPCNQLALREDAVAVNSATDAPDCN